MAEHQFSIRLYLKLDKARKDGSVPIYAKLLLNGQKTEITTGKTILPKYWNIQTQRATKYQEAEEINRFLDAFRAKLNSAFTQLYIAGEPFNLDTVRRLALGENTAPKVRGLIDVMEEHNKHFLSLIPVQFSMGSYKNYKTTLNYLKEFIPKHYKKQDWPSDKVNYSFLEAYYHFLLTEKNCKINGANKQIQRVKKVVNYALKHDYIITNPTRTFSLKNEPVFKPFLTLEEIQAIADLQLQEGTLKKVRDVFLFQCYTGLAYCDIKELKPVHIQVLTGEEYWIKKQRQKSKIIFSVPLLPPALKLLKEYQTQEDKSIFPVLSNQKMNLNLKLIQQLAGIPKSLTTHLARHSFATTITLKHKVPIETVAKMMGHTKLSTTQIYAKVLDEKIREDMEGVKMVFGGKESNGEATSKK